MKYSFLETVIGFIVIIISITFLLYLYSFSQQQKDDNSYVIGATFQNVEGIITGSDVMISGIKVGVVGSLVLNPDVFDVLVKLYISKHISIPNNSSAAIVSSGLLGNKYIVITPGTSETFLRPNEPIKRTHSSVNIESIISQFMYSLN